MWQEMPYHKTMNVVTKKNDPSLNPKGSMGPFATRLARRGLDQLLYHRMGGTKKILAGKRADEVAECVGGEVVNNSPWEVVTRKLWSDTNP